MKFKVEKGNSVTFTYISVNNSMHMRVKRPIVIICYIEIDNV